MIVRETTKFYQANARNGGISEADGIKGMRMTAAAYNSFNPACNGQQWGSFDVAQKAVDRF
jgi:hypothetical protein